jgi:CheY-like chemotaxis protein
MAITEALRILVADDDPVLREILSEGLEEEGFEVVLAGDGAEALELLQSGTRYDALLLDEEMPRLSGRQLLAQLRRVRANVPALIISGNLVMNEDERNALGVPILLKPVSIREIAQVVREVIASRAPSP